MMFRNVNSVEGRMVLKRADFENGAMNKRYTQK
jgi:hypothetical protein